MKIVRRDLFATLVVAVLGTATLAWGSDGFSAFTAETARRQQVLRAPRALPTAVLEDQDGRRLTLQDFAGKRVAVEFIYTRCDSVCLTLGTAFRQIHQRLPEAARDSDIVLLSISFDPQRDDPAALRSYAGRFGADGESWRVVRPLASDDLPALLAAFGVVVIPNALGGFEHNAALHLVGRDGRLVEIRDLAAVDAFLADLEART